MQTTQATMYDLQKARSFPIHPAVSPLVLRSVKPNWNRMLWFRWKEVLKTKH